MPASKKEAKEFVKRWKKRLGAIPAGSNNEQQDTQKFWVDLLINVLGIPSNTIDSFVDFERKVRGRRIDVFVSDHNFLCEQKSWGIDLDKPEPRNGGMETPLQQAMWYARHLPYSERPRWVMTCNFGTFRLYDLDNERPEDTVQEFSLEELPDSLYLLSFLTSNETSRLHKEQQLSIEAGAYVSRLYDALAKQYHHIEEKDERAQEEQRSLNVLITRIIFLLYAEDADLLQSHQAFGRYCEGDPARLRRKLVDLFEAIDTPLDKRDEYMDEDLAAFPYVNGGLFADSSIIVPQMTPEILEAITDASQDFDWREISGVIFGGVFEGTLNPETRHAGACTTRASRISSAASGRSSSTSCGMSCTRPRARGRLPSASRPWRGCTTRWPPSPSATRHAARATSLPRRTGSCAPSRTESSRTSSARRPATRGRRPSSLRRIAPVRVSLDQLYGIEINDFAVSVAKTALWITEEQMLRKTQEIYVGYDFDFLPLRSLSNLHEGNALKTDWSEVFPDDLTYLVGNPPFLGARNQSKEQKAELLEVFDGAKNAGNIDYCGAWYMKAARFTQGKRTRCALVSTNSICQGEQVANLWKPLHDMGIHIDFAHNTFRWDNEAADKAHVFCVIVGFSREAGNKTLFYHATPDSDEDRIAVPRLNAYLKNAPDAFIWNRSKPLSDVPAIGIGSQPIDGGNYLFTPEEKAAFLSKEPAAEKYFHKWLGSQEFIRGIERWCLWLGEASWADLKGLPCCRERIENVRNYRLSSSRKQTLKAAERPNHFGTEIIPNSTAIIVPKVSSERRRYIPMGFVGSETLCSDLVFLIPNATLYHFGVLQSQLHNAWMRTVAGRLKSDYRYSGGIVYNNFVWPEPSEEQRNEVERCAQAVLDARDAQEGATLADMYDPKNETFFPELMTAHKALDAAVEAAYGVDFGGDEEKIVAHLFNLYAKKVGEL